MTPIKISKRAKQLFLNWLAIITIMVGVALALAGFMALIYFCDWMATRKVWWEAAIAITSIVILVTGTTGWAISEFVD